jgi:P27 family predicted phage terminase small subunit
LTNDLRTRLGAAFDLDEADPLWLALLDEACQAESVCRQLEDVIRSDGLLSSGSKGQVTVHPAVQALRAHQAHLAKMLMQLGIAEDDLATTRAKRASRARWSR